MKNAKSILTIAFGVFILFGGVVHFVKPEMYLPFIPDVLPKELVNIGAGIIEIIVGVCIFIPRFRSLGTLGILLMMVAFLPLHIIDIFKENPTIGSHQLALIRLPLQFILIAWAWFINKK
jgi:uncharacterized membrane protein